MKTLPGFIFLMGACAVCAAQTPATSSAPAASTEAPATSAASDSASVPPRTLPSHPETTPAAAQPTAAAKNQNGAYPGYRRVVVNGQELYCRNDLATGSHTKRTPACGTLAQVQAEQMAARNLLDEMIRRDATVLPPPANMGAMPMR